MDNNALDASVVEDDYDDSPILLGQASATPATPVAPARTRRFSFAEEEEHRPAKQKPGKKSHPIWNYFRKVGNPNKAHPSCVCKQQGCNAEFGSGFPSKNLKKHLLFDCRAISEFDKDTVRAMFGEAPALIPSISAASALPNPPTPADPLTQASFEIALAMMMYMCAVPFSLVESPSFIALFKLIAPTITLPDRHRLSGELLNQAHAEAKAKVKKVIADRKLVSVVTDGWTDTNGTSIVNFMVAAPNMTSMFWSSLSTGSDQHTAEYILEKMEQVIAEIEACGAKVVGVLTDNAPNQVSAWEKLEAKRPDIFGGGCAAHALNLVIEDVFKNNEMKNIKQAAVDIVKFVRDHHGLLDVFRKRQKVIIPDRSHRYALALPVPTRWYSVHACLRSVFENRSVLDDLFFGDYHDELHRRYGSTTSQKRRLNQIAGLLTDSSKFWTDLAEAIKLLDPVNTAIRKLESDKEPPSRVYERFKWLLTRSVYEGSSALQVLFKETIESRWNFVHTNAMGIAFLLDPTTKLTQFLDGDLEEAIAQAIEYATKSGLLQRLGDHGRGIDAATLRGDLYRFAGKKAELDCEGVNPLDWWKVRRSSYPNLFELAARVFAIPTSSAASERAWSIFDLIHTKKRNRLSTVKVEKLVHVYINGELSADQRFDMASLHYYPEMIHELKRLERQRRQNEATGTAAA